MDLQASKNPNNENAKMVQIINLLLNIFVLFPLSGVSKSMLEPNNSKFFASKDDNAVNVDSFGQSVQSSSQVIEQLDPLSQ